MKHTHAAYNLTTGEIITATRINTLNRVVKDHSGKGNKWVFAHGKECIKKVCEKAYRK